MYLGLVFAGLCVCVRWVTNDGSSQFILGDFRGMSVSTQQSCGATCDWKQQPIIPKALAW